MPAFTVQQLVDRAAAIADVQDNFVSPETWLSWFNSERKATILLRSRVNWIDDTLSSTTVDAATTPFIVITPIGNLAAILGVWEVSSSGRHRRLTRLDNTRTVDFLGIRDTANYWSYNRTEGSDQVLVNLLPRPTSGSYVCYYMEVTADATALTSTFYFTMGEDERVVLGMARRALIKEESDTSEVDKELVRWERNVEELAWMRAIDEVPTVRNVDSRVRGWESKLILPAFASWYWV